MSATSQLAYPNELKVSDWEKDKKSGFSAASDVAERLKALQKKHEAVNWKQFEEGWPKQATNAAELQQAFALRERVYRSSVFALKKDALGVAAAAKTEEKKAAKPWLDTLKAIGKSANGYADEVNKGVDALQTAFDKANEALPDDADDEESAPKALLDAKLLSKQLTLCRRDPERRMRFAFVDAKDRAQPAVLVLHPRMGARSLFSKLQSAAGVKAGAYGTAWVDATSLTLLLDKPLSGLVKKVRGPVKAAGFKIRKVVLVKDDGSVFEQDEEEADDAEGAAPDAGTAAKAEAPSAGTRPAPPGGPSKPAAPGEPKPRSPQMAAFMARLTALLALTTAAGDSPIAKQARLLGSEAGVFSRKGEWDRVDALMAQAEALIAGAAKTQGQAAPAATLAGGSSPGASATATSTAAAAAATTVTDDAPMARGTQQAPAMGGALAFKSRLTGLLPRIKAVEAAGGPVAVQVVAQRDAAIALVRQKGATPAQVAQALTLLDEIAALMPAASGGAPKVAGASGANAVFVQTRLEWDTARKTVQSELRKLEQSILAECASDPDLAEIAAGTKNLYGILDYLDERLIDKLDEAMNAAAPESRKALNEQAREIVGEYVDYVKGDALFNDIDDNGFVPVAIASTLKASLAHMARQLAAAAAA